MLLSTGMGLIVWKVSAFEPGHVTADLYLFYLG
jgi:hypothetical protein